MALISPTVGFHFSCISEVSVRFQGSRWPFLASLWTPPRCWGGCGTWRLESVWQLIGHVHQRCQTEPEEGSESLRAAESPCRDTCRVYGFVCVCVSQVLFSEKLISVIRATHFIYLLAGENAPLNLKSCSRYHCLNVCGERIDWCCSAAGRLNTVW